MNMKFLNKFFVLSFISSVLFVVPNSFAEGKKNNNGNNEQIQFDHWMQDFREIALKKGFDSAFLDRILPQISYVPRVIASDRKQSEFLMTFDRYIKGAISDSRIKRGKEIMKTHHDLIMKTSQKYGVQPEILVAFWGMETNYGSYKGDVRILDALATLAYDKRRRTFFTNELLTLLKIIETTEQTDLNGSWAGAFGNFQFMPSTYVAYAVDGDNDGKKDIVNSLPDAFESAANYLSQMGWNGQQSWGSEVVLSKKIDWKKVHSNKTLPVSAWETMGVLRADSKEWRPEMRDVQARLVMPSGIDGPKFLVYRNFDLIMRWNNSTLYALSVGILADKIKYNNAPIYTKSKQAPISRKDIRLLQTQLRRQGLYTGEIDGILGKGTRKAILLYQRSAGMAEDAYPSRRLLQQLRKREK